MRNKTINSDNCKKNSERMMLFIGQECYNFENRSNGSSVLGTIYCPMPFEAKEKRICCGEPRAQYCCESQHT